ncbi:hypothetical protein UFOVP442_9 [uncultured Caudovirales phage]|uniref:Uncharacterized protein n=1 Tax=uncultured Caudovirales phage TaxID=2100421 RepID=A0A6J5M854_9CAUD|nr:hypothetical protein UFOVP442_9 [uncultured Caudovirales phage]
MTTPLDIIQLSLKDAGVMGLGQTPLNEDLNDAFQRLNWMVSQWARKRWLIWHLVDVAKVSTGAQSYTVGPGGDFNLANRPDKLHAAYLRFNFGPSILTNPPQSIVPTGSPFVFIAPSNGNVLVGGGTVSGLFISYINGNPSWQVATSPIAVTAGDAVQVIYSVAPAMSFTPAVPALAPGDVPPNATDLPLSIIESREDWSIIRQKGLSGTTTHIFYDSIFPVAKVYPFPYPQIGQELHLIVKEQLPEFTSLSQNIILPPEYMAALHYNLAIRLRAAYNLPTPQIDPVAGFAADALNVIRSANFQIPRLRIAASLSRLGIYNVISDGYD